MSVEDLIELARPMFVGYSMVCPQLQPGVRFWRAQIIPEYPQDIRRLSYPPPEFAKQGRVNQAGAPRFYCSYSRRAAVFEISSHQGDEVTIGRWEVTQPILCNNAGYAPAEVPPGDKFRNATWWNEAGLWEDQRPVHEFIAQAFSEIVPEGELHRYGLTVALAKLLLTDQFDGLLYPTVAMHRNADNLALTPAAADGKLRLVYAERIRVTEASPDAVTYDRLDHANVAESGTLTWLGRPGEWKLKPGEEARAQAYDGHWILLDGSGNEIDPG